MVSGRIHKNAPLNMKKLIIALILLLITTPVFPDKLHVPFSVYPKEIQKVFADKGLKLDLNGNDRTRDSWGFIDNQGSFYYIYTYENLTSDELMLVMDIIWENEGVKRE